MTDTLVFVNPHDAGNVLKVQAGPGDLEVTVFQYDRCDIVLDVQQVEKLTHYLLNWLYTMSRQITRANNDLAQED